MSWDRGPNDPVPKLQEGHSIMWVPSIAIPFSRPVKAQKRLYGYIIDGKPGSRRLGTDIFDNPEDAKFKSHHLLRRELARLSGLSEMMNKQLDIA